MQLLPIMQTQLLTAVKNMFTTHPKLHQVDPSTVEAARPQVEHAGGSENGATIRHFLPMVLILTGAAFLNIASVTSTVILLPTISRELGVPQERQQWLINSYTITSGCLLLLFGKLGDVFGKRLIFLFGGLLVTVTSIATAFSPNEICFNVMRSMQGVGAAANVPTAMGIIGVTVPPGKFQNMSISIFAAGAPIGALAGNLLGGILAQYAHWTLVFYVISGFSAIITIAGFFVISNDVPSAFAESRTKLIVDIDWVGAFLVTAGLLLLITGVSEGNDPVVGWNAYLAPALMVVSVLMLACFAAWEYYLEQSTTRTPLMSVAVFKKKTFSICLVIMLLFWPAFNNFLVFATYFYQDYQHLSPIQTTVRFIPSGIVGIAASLITGKIMHRVSASVLLAAGTACTAIACLLFAVPIPASTTYWAYGFEGIVISVFGADVIYPSIQVVISHSLPQHEQALAGAIVDTAAQVGKALGLSLASTIFTAVQERGKKQPPQLMSVHAAQYFGFACCTTCMILAIVGLRGLGRIGNDRKRG
ncbi:efflux transporter [Phlyctema vagabunda]|uniref:Efflux transporter n=1 Tax=Phlyctema vagabunda TaxID=108571 RepID=A0ABR4PFQ0_9HELO